MKNKPVIDFFRALSGTRGEAAITNDHEMADEIDKNVDAIRNTLANEEFNTERTYDTSMRNLMQLINEQGIYTVSEEQIKAIKSTDLEILISKVGE